MTPRMPTDHTRYAALLTALLALLALVLVVVTSCVPAYTEDSPAVAKTIALTEDAAEVAALIDAAHAVLSDSESTPEAREAALADLEYASLLSSTAGTVADSLRRDLLCEEASEETDGEQEE